VAATRQAVNHIAAHAAEANEAKLHIREVSSLGRLVKYHSKSGRPPLPSGSHERYLS
jgi:hypothetical protein